MARFHTESNKSLAILAGDLGSALRMHAAQRAQYFFNFLFFHQALVDRLRAAHGQAVADGEGVSAKATHQIAYGLRRGDDAYYLFLDKDPKIVDQPATNCGRTDAAHYCNLGITGAFLGKIAPVARPDVDPVAFKLRNMLEVMAGATRQLPQRVNIGPDRVIDRLHGDLAARFLNGEPPLTPGNYATYLDLAAQQMDKYRKTHLTKRNLGIAACCDCYLDFYTGSAKCRGPYDSEGVLRMLRSGVETECAALGLDAARYVSRSVR
jgi:hypothetical protein